MNISESYDRHRTYYHAYPDYSRSVLKIPPYRKVRMQERLHYLYGKKGVLLMFDAVIYLWAEPGTESMPRVWRLSPRQTLRIATMSPILETVTTRLTWYTISPCRRWYS